MKNLILPFLMLLLVTTSCTKDEDKETTSVFYEVAGPSVFLVHYTDINNNLVRVDSAKLGWNLNSRIELGKTVTITAVKISDTTVNSVDFLRAYINGKLYQDIDTGYQTSLRISAVAQ